jgi:hypothetical protein
MWRFVRERAPSGFRHAKCLKEEVRRRNKRSGAGDAGRTMREARAMTGGRTGRRSLPGALLLLASFLVPLACDLTLTLEPETYASLDAAERAAADRIYAQLQLYDARLQAVSGARHTLGPLAIDRELVDVSVHELWVMANIGDDRVHLSVWENLTAGQRAEFARWFGEGVEAAAARYGYTFYEFIALHLAGVQTVFAVQGVDWVYRHRNLFNVDRDAQRLVDTYLAEMNTNLLSYAWATCASIRAAGDARFGAWYSMDGYGSHVRELTNPEDPSGQIYMICKHLEQAEIRRQTFNSSFLAEIEMLEMQRAADGAAVIE